MVNGDTTCVDATAAANAADRLVNSDGVSGIVGALCSGSTLSAANNVAIPGGVVMISPASTSPALTTLEDNDLVYRTAPSDAYQGEVMANMLQAKGFDNIAITYINNDYGKGFADSLSTAFANLGGTVAANEAHEEGKADYRAEVGSLASSGAEVLVVLAYADGSGQTVIRQAVEGGDFSMFVGGDGMVGTSLIEAVGADALEGMLLTRPASPEGDALNMYQEVAAAGEQDPNAVFGAQSYDAAFLLALALEKNGEMGKQDLSAALRSVASPPGEVILPGQWAKALEVLSGGGDVNYEGASGSHDFDNNGDVSGLIHEVQVQGGALADMGRIE